MRQDGRITHQDLEDLNVRYPTEPISTKLTKRVKTYLLNPISFRIFGNQSSNRALENHKP